MLANTAIAVLWMVTTLVWVVAFGLLLAWEYPNEHPRKLRAALLALLPAALPASTAIWVMSF